MPSLRMIQEHSDNKHIFERNRKRGPLLAHTQPSLLLILEKKVIFQTHQLQQLTVYFMKLPCLARNLAF